MADRDLALPGLTQEALLAWRSPRYGDANPTVHDNPLWAWLVRTRMNAYQANERLAGPASLGAGPMWCFDRFGRTETALPDGRTVLVAGEHEDSYDPDFFIYNDVVVLHPDGSIRILGYPVDVFPPTDFHSATLLPDRIVLVGCVGSVVEQAHEPTQVLALSLADFSVRRLEARGEHPGWLSRHDAALAEDGKTIVVTGGQVWTASASQPRDNVDEWALDLERATWTRRTRKDWPQWSFCRADRKSNHLWELRQALWKRRRAGWEANYEKSMRELSAKLGREPSLELLSSLYAFEGATVEEQDTDALQAWCILLDGVRVRFVEDMYAARVRVEGAVAPARLLALQASALDKLRRLENADWVVEPLDES